MRRLRGIDEAGLVVCEYAGSEAMKSIVTLVDLLIDEYKESLVTITQGRLPERQAVIQQLVALRAVMSGERSNDVRV